MKKRVIYTKEILQSIVDRSRSIADIARNLNIRPSGSSYRTISRYLKKFNIRVDHFTGQKWRAGVTIPVKPPKPLNEILVENSCYQSHKLKLRLISSGIKNHCCEICNQKEWMGQKIPLELEHCNGINTDNRIENLKIICPNCHAQTKHYRGRNKNVSALLEMRDAEYRKFKEALLTGNLEPSILIKGEGAETRHGRSKSKKCINCNIEFINSSKERKYCSVKCYREHTSEHIPKVPELLNAFKTYKNFCQVGKYFNVCDTAVKKWCKKYGILEMIKE